MRRYGLFGELRAQAGQGEELAEILLEAAARMNDAPGCVLYILTQETGERDAVWVMEVWESEEDHNDSLQLPGVHQLIGQTVPILAQPPEGGMALNLLGGNAILESPATGCKPNVHGPLRQGVGCTVRSGTGDTLKNSPTIL